jgi:hypothetical protein
MRTQHRAIHGVQIAMIATRSFSSRAAWVPIHFQSLNNVFRTVRLPYLKKIRSPRSISFTSSSAFSSITENMADSPTESFTSSAMPRVPIGGDYAGYLATYDPMDGSFIPVPEQFIPAAMLEWGQEPSTMELLVSEATECNDNNDVFKRQTVTLFPEVGCSIDNIETKKMKEEIEMANLWQQLDISNDDRLPSMPGETQNMNYKKGAVVCQQSLLELSSHKFSLETIFGFTMIPDSRVRIKFDIVFTSSDSAFDGKLNRPISVILERQVSTVSTNGTIADGGGLDGRRVATLIGPMLRKYSDFPKMKHFKSNQYERIQSQNDRNIIYFPGTNITFSSFYSSKENVFVVEVGQFFTNERTNMNCNLSLSKSSATDEQKNYSSEKRDFYYVVRRIFNSSYENSVQSTISEL